MRGRGCCSSKSTTKAFQNISVGVGVEMRRKELLFADAVLCIDRSTGRCSQAPHAIKGTGSGHDLYEGPRFLWPIDEPVHNHTSTTYVLCTPITPPQRLQICLSRVATSLVLTQMSPNINCTKLSIVRLVLQYCLVWGVATINMVRRAVPQSIGQKKRGPS